SSGRSKNGTRRAAVAISGRPTGFATGCSNEGCFSRTAPPAPAGRGSRPGVKTMTNAPEIKTALPGPRAKAIIERDRAVVSPSYTRGYPLVIERGAGSMVEDVDGNVFLDCSAGIAVTATGHSHPDVVRAITEQAGRFLHMSGTDFYYEVQVRLAEELASIVPMKGGVRSFFGNSGTEAIEACLKLARYATGRPGFIAFLGGFHGRTMGSLSLTASKAVQRHGF